MTPTGSIERVNTLKDYALRIIRSSNKNPKTNLNFDGLKQIKTCFDCLKQNALVKKRTLQEITATSTSNKNNNNTIMYNVYTLIFFNKQMDFWSSPQRCFKYLVFQPSKNKWHPLKTRFLALFLLSNVYMFDKFAMMY